MRQGTSRVIMIACSENFFKLLGFEAVFPDFRAVLDTFYLIFDELICSKNGSGRQ